MVICKFMKGFYFVISHQTIFILFGNSTFNITQNVCHFHFIRSFFKHLYYFKFMYLIYSNSIHSLTNSFICSLLTEKLSQRNARDHFSFDLSFYTLLP